MSTNSQVIQDALGLIGVTDDFNLSAEYGSLGLRAMNDLLLMWQDNGIDVGYAEQDTLTDDCPILPEHMLSVKYNLAVALAPYFSKMPSAALAAQALASYMRLQRDGQVALQKPVSVAPLGRDWSSWDIATDS
jgi:hypothetical protein